MTYLFVMNEKDPHYQQNQADLRFGYLIITVIFAIGLSVLGFGFFYLKNPDKVTVVLFDKVGNLKIDDPVYLIGVPVGKVKSIELRKQNALVHIRMRRPLKLHQGYRINNMDVGIMGDRMLSIEFGDTTRLLVKEKDTLIGIFHPGVSEAVGMAWKLQSVIDSFIVLSAKLLRTTPMQASFVQRVNEIARATDSATLTLAAIITSLSSGMSAELDSLTRLIGGIARFSSKADSFTVQQISGLGKLVGTMGSGLQKLETMVDNLVVVTGKLEKLESMDEKGTIAVFINKIKVLRDAVFHLKEGLLKLKNLAIEPS
jgi:ABC-type transporter Mla subunit MlaD